MTCIGPIPEHLKKYDWYAPHQAWLRKCGWPHHDPGGVDARYARLTGADLRAANLHDAILTRAVLTVTNLMGAHLRAANLAGARLTRADLSYADLSYAHMPRVVLTNADLRGADLSYADLPGAHLHDADLTYTILTDAVLTDGRTLAEWQADPLAGLCTDPEARARAIAAWGQHTWRDCPLHEGMGINGLYNINDDAKRRLAACFIALFDCHHLPKPGDEAAA